MVAVVGNGSSGSVGVTASAATAYLDGFIYTNTPTIFGSTPLSGAIGTVINITGADLYDTTVVNIGGVPALVVANASTNNLSAMVMPGATSGTITLTNGGNSANGSSNFQVTATEFPKMQQGGKLVGSGGSSTSTSGQGYSVAISANGNTAIVGGNTDSINMGAVWVYTRNGGVWSQQVAKLTPYNIAKGFSESAPDFGSAVSLSADGNTALIGGPNDSNYVGGTWVFVRNSNNDWTEQAKLPPPADMDGAPNLGTSVSLSGDGNTALVGGFDDSSGIGAAWVYTRSSGGTWTQLGTKLVGANSNGAAQQGYAVAISSDGKTALIGGNQDNNGQGAGWIFRYNGTSWIPQGTKLTDATGTNANQGSAVALSADGNTAIIGGPANNGEQGASWVFAYSGGSWIQQGKLIGTDAATLAQQGYAVSLSADGNTALATGFYDNNGVGAAWTFTRNGSIWTQQGNKLIGNSLVGQSYLGNAAALSSDGNTAILGGNNDSSGVGAAWAFITNPVPTITSFTPDSAIAGNVVTITGSGFSNLKSVTFGGVPPQSYSLSINGSDTSILATIGTGASGYLSITNNYGADSVAGFTFLTCKPTYSTTLRTICASELPYSWNGLSCDSAGAFNAKLKNKAGCDSIATLQLTVNPLPIPVFANTAIGCDSVVLIAGGGTNYLWNGGNTPNTRMNTFMNTGTYTVAVTDSNGCSASATKVVTVNPLPSATIVGATKGCNSVSLTAYGGNKYAWSGGTNLSSSINTITQSGSYTVTVTDTSTGCSATATRTDTVFTPIVPTITGNTVNCDSVVLVAAGGVDTSYGWSGGSNSASATNIFFSSGTYKLFSVDLNGCKDSASKSITVYAPPMVSLSGNDTACNSVTITASGGSSYSWTGGNPKNASTNTFTTSGHFTVTASNLNGCKTTDSVYVVVNTPPSVTITSGNNGCGSIYLTALTDTTTPKSYSWYGQGTDTTARTNTFTKAGTYKVLVTDSNKCQTTATYTISTITNQHTITLATVSTPYCLGQAVLTSSGVSNALRSAIYKDTMSQFTQKDTSIIVHIDTSKNNVLNPTPYTPNTVGKYYVIANFSDGCVANASANIYQANITINGLSSGCKSVTLTAAGGNNYKWNGGINPDSATNTFNTSQTVSVTGKDSNSCVSTLSEPIVVNPNLNPPTVTVTGNTTGCDSITLTARGGVNYSWNGGITSSNGTGTFKKTGTDSVVVTASNGCSVIKAVPIIINPHPFAYIPGFASTCGEVTLNATGGKYYHWSSGNNVNDSTNTFTQGGSQDVYVTVTDSNGCSVNVYDTIYVRAIPTVSISGITANCDSVTLIASGAAGYHWNAGKYSDSSTNVFKFTGIDTLIAIGSNGCRDTIAVPISVDPQSPSISIVATDTVVCSGKSVTFTATSLFGGTSPTYQWMKGGNPIVGATTTTYTYTPVNGDVITCSVTSNNVCVINPTNTSNGMTMSVFDYVTPSVSISSSPSSTIVATGGSITFTALPINGGSNHTYQWQVNGKYVDTNSATFKDTTVNNLDVINCLLTNNAACVTNSNATSNSLTVHLIPVISSFAPQKMNTGGTVTITGHYFTAASAVSFGDSVANSFTVVNDSTITAIVANGTSGSVGVTYKGNTGSKSGFTYLAPPIISSFSPANGCSGTSITITGAYFTEATSVSVGGVPVSSFKVVNDTSITAVIGKSPANGAVTVVSPYGTVNSAGNFTVGSGIVPYAYISNNSDNTVSVVNTNDNTVKAVIAVGTAPYGVSVSPDGSMVYVSNKGTNNVSVINTATNKVVATIAVGNTPAAVCVTPNGKSVYVSNYIGNTVSVINAANNTITATIPVGTTPNSVCVSPDGTKIYVVNAGDNTMSVINTATNTVSATVTIGNLPNMIAISPDGNTLYVGNITDHTISVINANTYNTITTIAEGTIPYGIAVSSDGKKAYVANISDNTVSVINTSTNTITATIAVGHEPFGVSITPDGSKLYVLDVSDNAISVINTSTNTTTNTIQVGNAPFAFCNFMGNIPILCPPVVSSFTPATAVSGSSVTIRGNGFANATGVSFGSTAATSFAVVNDSTITAVVGIGASGSVSVSNNGGTGSLAGFSYLSIASFTPAYGCAGTTITIKGTGFTGVTAVSIGGKAVTYFTVDSDTSISATINSNNTGIVSVITTYGSANSSSSFILGTNNVIAFLPDYSNNKISVEDTLGHFVITKVSVGTNPISSCGTPDGSRVYVANNGSNNVSIINTATNTVAGTIAVGNSPVGIVADPNGNYVYVSNITDNNLSIISTASNTVVGTVTLPVASNPYGLCISPDGTKVYVSDIGSSKVSVVSTASNTVTANISVGSGPTGICISPDGSTVYVENNSGGTLTVINTTTNTVTATLSIGTGAWGISINSDGSKVFASCNEGIYVIHTATNTVDAPVSRAVVSYVAYLENEMVNVLRPCPPVVSSFTPATAVTGSSVTIRGNGFTNATGVGFGGTAATSFTVVNDSTITAVVGSGASGSVSVSNNGGKGSLAGFIYLPPPVISSFTPTNGCSGTTIIISGANFTGAKSVTIGGVAVSSFTVNSDISITVVVNSINTGIISVTTPYGAVTSLGNFVISSGVTSYAYLTNSLTNTVSVINATTNVVLNSITVGNHPVGIGVSPDGSKVYVANQNSNSISVISTANNTLTWTVLVGTNPVGVCVSPDGTKAYVTNAVSGTVSVVNTANNTLASTITVGAGPTSICVSPDGAKIFVTNQGSNTVSIINAANNTVSAVPVGIAPCGITISPDGTKVYVANNSSFNISVINTSSNLVTSTVQVGLNPQGVSISPDGSQLYVANYSSNSVSIVNTATNAVIATVPVGTNPYGVSVSLDGSKVYVANYSSNSVSIINTATNTVSSTLSIGNGIVSMGNFISNTVTICPPTLSSFTPTTAATGTEVTISGRGFAYTTGVSFGGTAATSFTVVNDSTITAVVGNGASGSVSVSNNGGTGSLAGFSYLSIASFTPAYGCAGTTITIKGTSFTGVTAVSIGGKAVTSFTVDSDTSISAVVNGGNSGFIDVTTSFGTTLSTSTFIIGSGISTYAYIPNASSNTVSVMNTTNNSIVTNILVGTFPTGICISQDGTKAYVTNYNSNNVSVINTITNTVITTISVGTNPAGICVSPDGTKVYVGNATNNNVSIINTATNTVTGTIAVGNDPVGGVSMSGDGTKVYVTNYSSNTVSVINTLTNAVTATIQVGNGPKGICFSPDGSILYVTNSISNNVSVVNTLNNTVIATVTVGTSPQGITISPDGSKIYVGNNGTNNISVISATSNTVTATIAVGNEPYGVNVSPDGTKLYVLNFSDNNVSVIITATNSLQITVAVGNNPVCLGNFIAKVPTLCPPTITSFTPTTAATGTMVNISGGGFKNATGVGFGGIAATSFVVVNDSTITAIVAGGASGSVSVTTGGGTGSLAGFTYCTMVTPSVRIAASANVICSGTSVIFIATPTNGGSSPSYQWKKNGGNVGTNSSTLTDVSLADKDSITCLLTANNTCQTTATAISNTLTETLTTNVTPTVTIAITGGSQTICSGTSVTFTATTLNGGSSPSFQWKKNGNNVGTNSTIYSDLGLADNDSVTCVLTANNTCQTTATAISNTIIETVIANVTPSVTIAITSGSQSICAGTSVIFTATPLNGGGSPSYQWMKNGGNVGTNSSTYSDASLLNGDVITCVLASNNSCQTSSTSTSNSITETVTNNVTSSISIAITSGSQTICSGTSVTFTATPTNGGGNPSYQWKKNGSNVGTNSTTYTNSALTNGDVITCVLTSINTCQTASTATSNSIIETVTTNVTPSVSISTPEVTVLAGTPVSFTATPTNGGIIPSFQWKLNGVNVGSNSTTYTSAALANGDVISCELTANNICQTSTTVISNAITMNITSTITWTGNVSTNWNTAANWNINKVPANNSNVTIPSVITNQPSISRDVEVGDINLLGNININGHTLTIKGAVTGNGGLQASTTSSLVIGGTVGTIKFDANNNSLKDLTINGTVTLGNALNLYGTLTPSSGTLTTGGYLTLKSLASGTAVVGQVTGTISGTVNIERYLPQGYAAYRDLGVYVSNAGTIANTWGQSLNNYTAYTYNNGWSNQLPNSTILQPYTGYRVLVTGYKNPVVPSTITSNMNSDVTLGYTGTLLTGNQTIPLSGGTDKFSFISNPYASQVDFSALTSSGLYSGYWYLDPTTLYGSYENYNYFGTDIGASNVYAKTATQFLQPGQAFFVCSNTTGTPSLTFTESAKNNGNGQLGIFGITAPLNRIATGLFANGKNLDGAVAVFNSKFYNGVGKEDGLKISNQGENLTFNVAGKDLCANGLNLPTTTDELPLHLYNLKENTIYTLRLDASQFKGNGLSAYFKDNVLNKQSLLSGDSNIVTFTTTTDTATYSNRYRIVFKPTTLPIQSINLTATVQQGNQIAIKWSVVGEGNVVSYQVERSSNGINFIDLSTVSPASSSNYSYVDVTANERANYYRIKSVENDGSVKFSNVVQLTTNNLPLTTISVYPNPVTNNNFKIGLVSVGRYSISLVDKGGKVVYSTTLNHTVSNAFENIVFGKSLAAGSYTLTVTDEYGKISSKEIIIQ